jgi:predicted unusual protein kinase regulating ubiquinone biosynthesis (AarF/ABC1/UbiB family)
MKPPPLVHVPTINPELSGTRVLTMDFINGVQVNKSGALDQAGVDRVVLTQAFPRALIKQIFIDGFFHGDPHPGNIFFDLDRGALTYIDLGLVGRLDETRRLDLLDLLYSFQESDTLAELLKTHRASAGLTQRELAACAGMSARSVQDIERGLSVPHRRTLWRLTAALRLHGEERW